MSSTQINLTWNASSDDTAVIGYKVFRGGVEIATVTGTSHSNTGLTPNTTYSYTVAAFDAVPNTSAQSSPAVSVTTQASADTTPPTVPENLAATAFSATRIDLTWDASTDNTAVTGYRVFRNGNPTAIATVTDTSYSNTGLTPNTTYSYTVEAFDAANNPSGQSAADSADDLARYQPARRFRRVLRARQCRPPRSISPGRPRPTMSR